MSAFNAIGEGGLNEVLQRRLTVQGAAPAPTVEPALFAGITLENDRPEYGYLKGELRFAASGSVAAGGAGLRSSVQLINTRPSQLLVVDQARLFLPAGATFTARLVFWGLAVLPAGTPRTSVAIDTRTGGTALARGSAVVLEDNTLGAVAVTTFDLAFNAAAFQADVLGPVILSPGWSLYLAPNADNVAITVYSLRWSERQAQPRELV